MRAGGKHPPQTLINTLKKHSSYRVKGLICLWFHTVYSLFVHLSICILSATKEASDLKLNDSFFFLKSHFDRLKILNCTIFFMGQNAKSF